MNFASFDFLQFFIITYSIYLLLSKRWQNWLLLGASYYFYAAWDWRFLILILLSTGLDFCVANALTKTDAPQRRKALLATSLAFNIGALAFFKYFGFFADSLETLLLTVGIPADWNTLNIILPVGISFYTFQTLSYTIDVYRRKLTPVSSLLDFAVFVAFFPQLVAGPIERASHFLPQVVKKRTITVNKVSRGSFLILYGLFKKVAIANGLATAVDTVYNSPTTLGTLDIILATYLFAIQIYCDFSGYTDIARGLAKLLGFDLILNFNTPYFSVNPSEFWQRWHISLSSWLRDYLYIPLGGNRKGTPKTYRNLLVTMILGGIWHGAAWNFVYWGIYQGAILCIHRLISGAKATIKPVTGFKSGLRRAVFIIGFFQVTCYGWLLFRASSWTQIWAFSDRLFLHPVWGRPIIPLPPPAAAAGVCLLILLDLVQYLSGTALFYRRWPTAIKAALYSILVVVLLTGFAVPSTAFIYFQF